MLRGLRNLRDMYGICGDTVILVRYLYAVKTGIAYIKSLRLSSILPDIPGETRASIQFQRLIPAYDRPAGNMNIG